MSLNMSKFCRALQAGFKINAGKFLSDKEAGWQPVVRAQEVEQFLATHTCEPIGDTPVKLLEEFLSLDADHEFVPDDLIRRMKALTKK